MMKFLSFLAFRANNATLVVTLIVLSTANLMLLFFNSNTNENSDDFNKRLLEGLEEELKELKLEGRDSFDFNSLVNDTISDEDYWEQKEKLEHAKAGKTWVKRKIIRSRKVVKKKEVEDPFLKKAWYYLRETQVREDKKMMKRLSKFYLNQEVKCKPVFDNITSDIDNAVGLTIQKRKKTSLTLKEDYYLHLTKNCYRFKEIRGYIQSSLTPEEENFPIAFSIVAYRDIELLERLLRSIYRPQNYYCIHIDKKSHGKIYEAVEAIAKCLPNIILPSRRVAVSWGAFSVLEPDVICMEALWPHSKKWKYFINLTGQEFPLKTNYELVKILTAYDGANDVEGTIKRSNPERWEKTKVPPGITVVKGSMKVAINRDFVGYILNNKTGIAVVDWLRTFCDVCVPDEQLFATLNHNPQLGIRGSYLGEPETDETDRKPFLARFVNWGHRGLVCSGKRIRGVCILSTGDLHLLSNRRELFANKFYLDSRLGDRVAVDCMEEWHFNRTRDLYLGTVTFDPSYYKNLGFVKDQVR